MWLPNELWLHVFQFLTIEERLRFQDIFLPLLLKLGFPRNIETKIILEVGDKYNLWNVMHFALDTTTDVDALVNVLSIASRKGILKLVERVLLLLQNKRVNYNNAFREAIVGGHVAIVERLLKIPGVRPTDGDNAAIRFAAQNGHVDIVERLLQVPGVDPTACKNFAFIFATQNGHLAVVERLLQVPGVDATAGDNFAIKWAARKGHFDIVNRLLQVPEVDPTAENNYAILWAAKNRHIAIVERLLQIHSIQSKGCDNYNFALTFFNKYRN